MTNGTEQTTGWDHTLAHQSKEIILPLFLSADNNAPHCWRCGESGSTVINNYHYTRLRYLSSLPCFGGRGFTGISIGQTGSLRSSHSLCRLISIQYVQDFLQQEWRRNIWSLQSPGAMEWPQAELRTGTLTSSDLGWGAHLSFEVHSRTVPEISQRSFACKGTSLRYSLIIRGDAGSQQFSKFNSTL